METLDTAARELKSKGRLMQSAIVVPALLLVAAGWWTMDRPGVQSLSIILFGCGLLVAIVGLVIVRLVQISRVKKLASRHGLDPTELRMRAGIH